MEHPIDEQLLRRFRAAATPGLEETRYHLQKFVKFDTEEPYSIDKYYKSIPTFESIFIPVSVEEAQAIVARYREIYRLKGPYPSMEQKKALQSLQRRLDDQLRKYGGGFVRLSRRSPKDAIYQCPVLLERAKNALMTDLTSIESPTKHDEMLALFHSMSKALQVTNGEEALEMVTHSERVFVDLLLALDFTQAWSVQAAVRKWTAMPIEAEFRGFVHGGNLTALCQYCDLCYFPLVVANKEKIQMRIVALFEQIKASGTLPFQNCVMDFACLPEQTLVIEINPWLESTGAGLFDWRRDKNVLENGPLEFRLLAKHPEHNYDGFLSDDWSSLLTEVKAEMQARKANRAPVRAVTPSDVTPSMPTVCRIS